MSPLGEADMNVLNMPIDREQFKVCPRISLAHHFVVVFLG
jgi:hypothetical protein